MILVVDDNAILRMHAAELLRDAGYGVVEAPDTNVALTILEGRSDIRLLFTDVQLPTSSDGLALAEQVQRRWPKILLLITSGGPKVMDEKIPRDGRFLTKPYSDREVLGHVGAMIANQRESRAAVATSP